MKQLNIIKINENVFKIYNSYNNNYYNAININNILVSYINNKLNNEKMLEILGKDYDKIINILTNKYKEEFGIITTRKEMKELKNKIEEEMIKSKQLSEMNIKLSKKNDKKEEEIKKLNEANNQLKIKLDNYQKLFEIEIFRTQNSIINFETDPNELIYVKKVKKGYKFLNIFEVYVGMKDNEAYLIYQKNNYNLNIMRIIDNTLIKSLIGHEAYIEIIKYYHKKNSEEEYILSCDTANFVIVWDINDNFNMKYSIQEEYKDKINDVLILFNVFNEDYIYLCSSNENYYDYSKLYEIKYKTHFIKNIFNTNKIKDNYSTLWLYKNKYYIISCCDIGISINNIFEDENYANLNEKSQKDYYYCLLYNDNYLCVSNKNNNYITIWDLVKKTIDKKISFDAKIGYKMIQWNDKYIIIECGDCLIVIDIKEGKECKKIFGKNKKIYELKKINIENIGECLVCSEGKNCINIYTISENLNKFDKNDDSSLSSDNENSENNYQFGRKRRKSSNDSITD